MSLGDIYTICSGVRYIRVNFIPFFLAAAQGTLREKLSNEELGRPMFAPEPVRAFLSNVTWRRPSNVAF